MPSRYTVIALVAALAALMDQATKVLVLYLLPKYTQIPVLDGFFNLVHYRNRGAAFGFLNRDDISWQLWLFIAATVLAYTVVIVLAKNAKASDTSFFVALGLIIGGATGNLVDRIRLREVVDFLDFYIGQYHWPIFNMADIAICCGAVIACIFSLRRTPAKRKALG